MGLIATDYLQQAQALLPPGPAWPLEADASLTQMLDAWSQEFLRVDGSARALLDEADPRNTSQMLADWERVCALPGGGSSQAQRAALLGQLTSTGGQSRAYYIALAASIGYAVTITEFRSHTVEDDVNAALNGGAWDFAWQINAALNTVNEFTVEMTVEDALAAWGNALLESVINRLKPAHTTLLYSYT